MTFIRLRRSDIWHTVGRGDLTVCGKRLHRSGSTTTAATIPTPTRTCPVCDTGTQRPWRRK
jgi:hypothetical protein